MVLYNISQNYIKFRAPYSNLNYKTLLWQQLSSYEQRRKADMHLFV